MPENNNTVDKRKEQETDSSHTVVGIRFRCCGKVYNFELNGIDAKPGEQVIVESEMGLNIGRVVTPAKTIKNPAKALKKVLRVATEEDFSKRKDNKAVEEEAKAFCSEKAGELNLDMKIVFTEASLDRKRFIFYFTADGRIDFRGLVRDLAARFKTRIEMRQIGVRDEVKLLGGLGPCGRQTCCSSFLSSFEPITIRMAKQQDLSINQSKLSGICGRLMCCLGYEVRDSGGKGEVLTAEAVGKRIRGDNETSAEISLEESPGKKVSEGRTAENDKAGTAIPGKAKSETPSQGPANDERKRSRRRRPRRRFKKREGEKPSVDKTPSQAEPQKQEKKEGPGKGEKGKPFNKRRRFRKKKRPAQ